MLFRKLFILLFILPFCFGKASAQEEYFSTDEALGYQHHQSIIYVCTGYPIPVTTSNFFDQYSTLIKGSTQTFDSDYTFGVGLKMRIGQKYRLTISADMTEAYLNDNPLYSPNDSDTILTTMNESIKMSMIPVFISFEYMPVDVQFKTYMGIGAGVAFGSLKWTEGRVVTNDPHNKRIGGEHYNESFAAPGLRAYVGMELGFDKDFQDNFLGSLLLEMRCSYFFHKAGLFTDIAEQFDNTEIAGEENTILPAYIGLNIGVTFNVFNVTK